VSLRARADGLEVALPPLVVWREAAAGLSRRWRTRPSAELDGRRAACSWCLLSTLATWSAVPEAVRQAR
jgi:hypothetical protein